MKKIIHHIRKQPDHVKSRYVIVFAVVATVIIVGVWMLTMRMIEQNDDTIKTESPFKMVTSIFSNVISETKENYQKQKTLVPVKDISDSVVDSPITDTQSTSDQVQN